MSRSLPRLDFDFPVSDVPSASSIRFFNGPRIELAKFPISIVSTHDSALALASSPTCFFSFLDFFTFLFFVSIHSL